MASSSRRRLDITVAAKADIDDALLYTRKRWGVEQRHRYRRRLTATMRSLRDHPELGRPRDELYLGCRSLPVEHHVIFYFLTEDSIIIARVLHGSQDTTGKVGP